MRLLIHDSNKPVFWRVAADAITQRAVCVASQRVWESAGAELLHPVRSAALSRGADQVVVV